MKHEGRRVLVVDDDPEMLDLLTLVLEVEGYCVTRALNGLDALASVEKERPDLILLDMKMPVMSGWEFAREFRSRHGDEIPIVVVTASANARRIATEIGASGSVGKPFDLKRLKRTVASHTGSDARA